MFLVFFDDEIYTLDKLTSVEFKLLSILSKEYGVKVVSLNDEKPVQLKNGEWYGIDDFKDVKI